MPSLVVADTSALLSLGVGAQEAQRNSFPDSLACLVQSRDVLIPRAVEQEIVDAANYTPAGIVAHGANDVFSYTSCGDITIESSSSPAQLAPSLDKGERRAIQLANDEGADEFLCDEINPSNMIVISQALATPSSVSSIELVCELIVEGVIQKSQGEVLLQTIAPHRNWCNNSHFQTIMNGRF